MVWVYSSFMLFIGIVSGVSSYVCFEHADIIYAGILWLVIAVFSFGAGIYMTVVNIKER